MVNVLTGAQLDGAALAREMNRPRRRRGRLPLPVVRRVPGYATFPWGIVDELERRGVRARWRFGARDADLHRALAENRVAMPIVGEFLRWRDRRLHLWAHVLAVAAFDREQGWGLVDPATTQPMRWQPPDEFWAAWHAWGHLLVETL